MTLKKVSEREREKLNECQRYLNETNGIYFQARKEDVQITHTNKKKLWIELWNECNGKLIILIELLSSCSR